MSTSDKFFTVVVVVTCVKFVLIPSYKSTDFEVHRNWLALTHNLPVSKWYYENTSEWTLDYPPLFAWFEWLLSQAAVYFDPAMLQISNINYSSPMTIVFQRLTVIFTDFVFVYAVHQLCQLIIDKRGNGLDEWTNPKVILTMLMLWNPGLFIVDHIHFQYNGFLYGLMLLSAVRIMQGRALEGSLLFCVLLNLKHIYLYVAPVYFVQLLLCYCFTPGKPIRISNFRVSRFFMLCIIVTGVFGLSFGPFIIQGQLGQVLSRLFPFKRGLTHAYWAPNFWALYNAADKLLSVVGAQLLNWQLPPDTAVFTGGLVKEFRHAVLPSVSPPVTLFLTSLSVLPAVWLLYKRPGDPWNFVRGLVLCAFGSFLFGWHVHEKAALMIVLPLTPLALVSFQEASIFALLAPVAHFSLFPLLHQSAETPIKVLFVVMHSVYIFTTVRQLYRSRKKSKSFLTPLEMVYLFGLVPLQCFDSFGARISGLDLRFPFLPLLMTSVYCGLGLFYCWLKFCASCFRIAADEVNKAL